MITGIADLITQECSPSCKWSELTVQTEWHKRGGGDLRPFIPKTVFLKGASKLNFYVLCEVQKDLHDFYRGIFFFLML
jgi:hypothetical protein